MFFIWQINSKLPAQLTHPAILPFIKTTGILSKLRYFEIYQSQTAFQPGFLSIFKKNFKKYSTLCCIVPNITLSLTYQMKKGDHEYR